MSGLEFPRAIRDGELPPPPIASLLGFRPSKVKPGRRVAFASAEIMDAVGKVVATATSSCLVMAAAGL